MTGPDGGGSTDRQAEAAAWFTRMNSGEVTPAEIDEFRTWYARCRDNAAEYHRLERLWMQFDRLPIASREHKTRAPQRLSRRTLLIGGGVTASALAAGWLGNIQDYIVSDEFTAIAEIRETRLPDGTGVTLDADSALAIDFSDDRRRLRLQRGRAFFDVAADGRRPFAVEAKGGQVEALGTQFVVSIFGDEVSTSVQESAVSVTAPSGEHIRLSAGETVSYRAAGLGAVGVADAEIDTAWRHGRLIFNDKPLNSVVSDVNRYRHGRLQIVGTSLERLRVSGVFDVKNPDGILDAIVSTLPVRAIEVTPLLVLLLPRAIV